MKRWQWIAAVPLLIVLIGAIGYLGFRSSPANAAETPEAPPTVAVTVCDVEKTVTAPGSLVSARQTTLGMPVAGRLAEVLVQAGAHVTAGQALARLDDRAALEEAVSAAQVKVLEAQQKLDALPLEARKEAAQLQLDLLDAQDDLDEAERVRTFLYYPEETQESVVRKARQTYVAAQKAYEKALREYNEKARLPQGHPNRKKAEEALNLAKLARDRAEAELQWLLEDTSQEAMQRADADVALALAKVDEINLRLEALHNGPAELDRQQAEAELAQARAGLETAQNTLEHAEITAPFDGVVLEVDADPGENLAANEPVLLIGDPQALEVAAQVIEEDLPLVAVGQAATLYFDAAPDAEISGRVARIVPQRLSGDRPLYMVYIMLDEIPAGLAAGMSADVAVVLDRAEGVLCLPRALVKASADNTATVKVWTGEATEERTVQVGLRGDTNVAILSGLSEDEQVVAR